MLQKRWVSLDSKPELFTIMVARVASWVFIYSVLEGLPGKVTHISPLVPLGPW